MSVEAGNAAEGSFFRRSALLAAAGMLLLALFLAVRPVGGESAFVFYAGDLSQKLLTAERGQALPADVTTPVPPEGVSFVETPVVDMPAGHLRVQVRYSAESEGNFLWAARFSDGKRLSSAALPPGRDTASLDLENSEPLEALTFGVAYGGQGKLSVSRISAGSAPLLPGPWGALWLRSIPFLFAALWLAGTLVLRRGLRPLISGRTVLCAAFAAAAPLLFLVPGAVSAGMFPGLVPSSADLTFLCLAMALILALSFGLSTRSLLRNMGTFLVFALPFAALELATIGRESGAYSLDSSFRMGLRLLSVLFLLEGMAAAAASSVKGREVSVRRRWVLAFTAAEILALIPPLVLVVYRLAFGQTFALPAIEAIWQTNPHEALRFASAYVPHLIALVIAASAMVKGVWTLNVKRLSRLSAEADSVPSRPFHLSASAVRIVLMLLAAGIVREALAAPVGTQFAETFQYFRRIAARKTPAHAAVVRRDGQRDADRGPRTHLVVIGESAGRDHLSLYGYGRPTTPWLEAMAREKGLLVFRSAYAGSKYTYHALEMALTEADQYDRRRFEDSLTLPEALQEAGFAVTWLSNQERDFNKGMPFGIMAASCGRSEWTARPAESFDMELADLLTRTADTSRDSVVIIHLNGSHLIYRDRTPEEKRRFAGQSDDAVNDAYDDSILYTDSVLEALFNYAEAHLNLATFTYFSDHGEVPGVPRDTFLWGMARIPFVLWMSEDFRASHEELAGRLSARLDDFWTNDLFFDLALSLFGVDSDRREAGKDLSSREWRMRGADMTTEKGRYFLCGDPGLGDYWKACVRSGGSEEKPADAGAN